MEELFRFIQQAVVVPADGEQIDLTTDSHFQDELRRLAGVGSHSDVRSEAEKFLDDIYGAGNGNGGGGNGNGPNADHDYAEDYDGSLERVHKYVQLRDKLHALLATSAATDNQINLAVRDVFGKYASDVVKSPEFVTDKKFASDVLVAVKLVTRFDLDAVAAVTSMRQLIAFVEDLVAGRATADWHPVQLTPPTTASGDSGVAAVSRDPGHMSLFWIGHDESVHTAKWATGSGWSELKPIPGTDDASRSSGVAAVSRDNDHMNVWWITNGGQVMVAEWAGDAWGEPEEIAGATDASPNSGVVALSRSSTHMEVWWIGKNGLVRNAWWIQGDGWKVNQHPLASNASPTSGLAVLSRSSTHMELWWIDKNQLVQGAWWVQGDGWHGPYLVAGPTKASASSGVAAVSRVPSEMDVWWIGDDGSLKDSRWTKADGWKLPPQTVAGRDSASTSGGVAALSRNSTHMQVWWIGQDRSIREARWGPDAWRNPKSVAEANSASSTSGIAALSRMPSHMELAWIGKDRAVQDAWRLDTAPEESAAEHIRNLLQRPMQFPEAILPSPAPAESLVAAAGQAAAVAPDPEGERLGELIEQEASFQRAYETLMSLPSGQLEIKDSNDGQPPAPEAPNRGPAGEGEQEPATATALASRAAKVLGVSEATLTSMDSVVVEHLRAQLGEPHAAAHDHILDVVKRHWLDVSRELEPLRTQTPARVYRIGMNLFAVQEPQAGALPAQADPPPMPDFSHAVARPVGIGDLQVVRQTLIGYEAADISHIENVLPHELMRRTTTREETTELIITEESETTQSEERDTQTTDRNELVGETQKEASQQSATTADQTTSSNYGRLVENSKTNYARNVTDRAVSKLTQTVRQQRVQREKRVFTDEVLHQIDNTTGQNTIRGIYQWVDKKYQVKVLNYGKRLLYDVVIPEPAAFLIDSLKKAAQPEIFALTKPTPLALQPSALNFTNFETLATTYGVSGAVKPPPKEFDWVVAKAEPVHVENNQMTSYGVEKRDKMYYVSEKMKIPNDYKAVSGYVATTKGFTIDNLLPQPVWEFYIGQTLVSFNGHGVQGFTLNNETGEIAYQLVVYPRMNNLSYAIHIKCERTAEAYKQWQLDTHATIIAGYQRQKTNYLDELSKYQAALRTQMALGHGFSRDSTMERQELKRAFIYLLMAEHFGAVYFGTPDPVKWPPDRPYAEYVKKWGAVTAFFERAFEWEHLMYIYYPYFWGGQPKWGELILIQDLDPQFEAFLKAGAARVVVPVRPGFEGALAHYHETGDVWMGEEIPDMFSKQYVSIIAEIKARNAAPGEEVCVEEWEVRLPTALVIAREDNDLPEWTPVPCHPDADA